MKMFASHDTAYFLRRESQERQLAERATDRAVRQVHRAMADRYAGLVRKTPAARATHA